MVFFQKTLYFSCNQCGACCREYQIPVSHVDVQRLLAAHPDQPIKALFRLRPAPPDDAEAILIEQTYWHLLLQRHAEGCLFLQTDGRCGSYDSRPQACRTFPFDRKRGLIQILPDALPAYEVHCDRERVPKTMIKQAHQDNLDGSRHFNAYRNLISRWNQWVAQTPERQTLEQFIAFMQTVGELSVRD